MNKKVITCTICENHCSVEVKTEQGEILDITGNLCHRGAILAQGEVMNEMPVDEA